MNFAELPDTTATLAADLEAMWSSGEVSPREYEAALAEVAELRELESEVGS